MIGDNNTQEFVEALMERSLRLDGRELFQIRNVHVEFTGKHGNLSINKAVCYTLKAQLKFLSKLAPKS